MAKMLLINPRKRARKTSAKRRVHRRKNPVTPLVHAKRRVVRSRKSNPIGLARARRHIRHRNPIGGLDTHTMMSEFKEAGMGALGSVGFDVLWAKINPSLPASLQTTSAPGLGDVIKAVATVFIGTALKHSTKGASVSLARGALTTQFAALIAAYLPDTMPLAGVGYASPARVIHGSNRLRPIMSNVSAYLPANTASPVLGAYQSRGGMSPVLGGGGARTREGGPVR